MAHDGDTKKVAGSFNFSDKLALALGVFLAQPFTAFEQSVQYHSFIFSQKYHGSIHNSVPDVRSDP